MSFCYSFVVHLESKKWKIMGQCWEVSSHLSIYYHVNHSEWLTACVTPLPHSHQTIFSVTTWTSHPQGHIKWNMDATIFNDINSFEISICLRNEKGNFIDAKREICLLLDYWQAYQYRRRLQIYKKRSSPQGLELLNSFG